MESIGPRQQQSRIFLFLLFTSTCVHMERSYVLSRSLFFLIPLLFMYYLLMELNNSHFMVEQKKAVTDEANHKLFHGETSKSVKE